jgi:hypothetical protein
MQNPFESGQIKNYLVLYGGVVVIMILFFIATTLFNEVQEVDTKRFKTADVKTQVSQSMTQENNTTSRFKLLDRAY